MPATPAGTEVVEHEIWVAARPETVFSFFTDPMKMIQWMGIQATLDPRPGGVCRIRFRPRRAVIDFWQSALGLQREPPGVAETGVVMSGEFVAIDPPKRISLTWGWEQELFATPPQTTAVEVSFTPDDSGTLVRLAHRRLHAAAVEFHRNGWGHYLPRLALVAAGRDPGPDPLEASTKEN
ncbi:MAG TPA: SRPBCC domain-containing protein [Thermoleophilaceae bacterium]